MLLTLHLGYLVPWFQGHVFMSTCHDCQQGLEGIKYIANGRLAFLAGCGQTCYSKVLV